MKTKKILPDIKIQLQVKGKDSGYLSSATDEMGYFELDNKYQGQQIAYYLHGTTSSEWITAQDGAVLKIPSTPSTTNTTDSSKTTTQSYK